MISFTFPEPNFKFKQSAKGYEIWDGFRKKWVSLQPEEWVRQNVLSWLINVQHIPAAYISVEKALPAVSKKRYDILVFNRMHQPWMIVECKAPEVKLDQKVLMQILSYHRSLQVFFIAITNGLDFHIAELGELNRPWLDSFPKF